MTIVVVVIMITLLLRKIGAIFEQLKQDVLAANLDGWAALQLTMGI